MSLYSLTYLSLFLNYAVQAVSLYALSWLFQRTRLPAVGAYLAWRSFSVVFGFVSPPFFRNATHIVGGVTMTNPWFAVWSLLHALLDAGLFAWMLFALVEWARPETPLLPLFGSRPDDGRGDNQAGVLSDGPAI